MTYSDLKTDVLTFCDQVGSTDAIAVVERGLHYAMRYVARKCELVGLIQESTYTWQGSDTSVLLFDPAGFNITQSQYGSPNNLFVRQNTDNEAPGIPFQFIQYTQWLNLKSVATNEFRDSLFDPCTSDERPSRTFTLTPDNKMLVHPIGEDNVLTFLWNKRPAAYNDNNSPEIPPDFDYIISNGASLILKEWIREPDAIVDPMKILAALDPQIDEMKTALNSNRRRDVVKMHGSYRL